MEIRIFEFPSLVWSPDLLDENMHLLRIGVVYLDLNGTGLEQMSDNKDKYFP